jgi:MFS family permease
LATIRSTFHAPATATPAPPRSYYGYWLIVAAFVAQFMSVGVQVYVVGSFLEPMTTDLGWTRSQFTLAGTVGQVVLAAAGFVVGTHVDRHGARRLMLAGVVVMTVALLALAEVDQLWQWILLHGVVVSAGGAMTGNLVVNITLSKWFVERRGMAVGWASMGVSLGGVALAPAITAIIDEWGWRTGWRVMAVAAVALIVPAALAMRRAPEDHGLFPDGKTAEEAAGSGGDRARADYDASLTRAEALRTRAFYLLVVAFGMFSVTISVMLLQTIPFVTDAGYSRGRAALMLTTAVPALLSKPVWGYLMDRVAPHKLASLGSALTGTAMVIITLSVRATADPLVMLGFFLLGCGWGGLIPLQEVIWATFFGRRYIGAVRSAALPFALVIGAGAPLLASLYFDRVGNYDGAFLTVAAMNATAAVLLLFVRHPSRGGAATAPTT